MKFRGNAMTHREVFSIFFCVCFEMSRNGLFFFLAYRMLVYWDRERWLDHFSPGQRATRQSGEGSTWGVNVRTESAWPTSEDSAVPAGGGRTRPSPRRAHGRVSRKHKLHRRLQTAAPAPGGGDAAAPRAPATPDRNVSEPRRVLFVHKQVYFLFQGIL